MVVGRAPVHVLAGFLAGLLNRWSPLVSLQLVLLFLGYELLEQLRIHDRSYRDVLEFTLGWLPGVALACSLP